MTRKTKGQQAEPIIQADPTAPRERDAFGSELDQWGLPLSGPIRARMLAELGKPDPNEDPAAWDDGANASPASSPDVPADNAAETEMNDG